jgi:alpha-ketoglutarate-dependent 2,4-dichlorophenoxyacetate dioxygenase
MALVTNQMHPLFAAEIIGADIIFDPVTYFVDAVSAAVAKYAVIVLRDQFIDDAEQVKFSRQFGPLELPPHMGLKGTIQRRIHPAMYDVSNLDSEGELLPEGDLRLLSNRANEEFHTDSSFNALSTKWSFLSARILPPEGGDTLYVDTRAVWDGLPEAMKQKAKDAVAEHYFWKTRGRAGYQIDEDMQRAMPAVQHKLVRVIPESGRTALYIGNHSTHIIGWPREEGEQFLRELNDFATQDQFIYTHRWRTGDLVIWDNRCTLHRATPFDVFEHRRDMRRTTVNEYGPETSSTAALGIRPRR